MRRFLFGYIVTGIPDVNGSEMEGCKFPAIGFD
jgi:hypothetical protein